MRVPYAGLPAVIVLLLAPSSFGNDGNAATATAGTCVEWVFDDVDFAANPFDVVARAVFTNIETGETRTTELFYAGDRSWRVRFTGTEPGRWRFETQCDGRGGLSDLAALHGLRGSVVVSDEPGPHTHGFMTHFGSKWGWQGTGRALQASLLPFAAPVG